MKTEIHSTIRGSYQYEEVTEGMNGYPKNIYPVIITADQSLSSLKSIAEETGGEIVLLKKRQGQDLWANQGRFLYDNLTSIPLKESETSIICDEDSVEDAAMTLILGYMTLTEYLSETLNSSGFLDSQIEEVETSISQIKDFRDEIVASVNGETLIVLDVNNRSVDYAVSDDDVSFTEDVWQYQLAVMVERLPVQIVQTDSGEFEVQNYLTEEDVDIPLNSLEEAREFCSENDLNIMQQPTSPS